MQFDGAIIREQGVTFAIVIVNQHTINNLHESQDAMERFQPVFQGIPVVLMAQDNHGRPSYRGRPDIARFLSRVSMHRIPWKRYTLN